MNKKMFLAVFFILFISVHSAFAENLSSHLERLYKLQADKNDYLKFAKQSNLEIVEDRVVVTVLAKQGITTADIDEHNLTAFGARIQAKAKHSMRVEIPISALEDVSNALTGLGQITSPIKPEEHAVTSEGVVLMNGDEWHSAGYEGSGVKVAVIDGGFDSLTEAQATGDIPITYVSQDFEGGGLQTTTPHGTAVTEAIYDLVPDAEFYLYKIADLTDFEIAIDSCISKGVDIINHSMGWFNAGGYYDGTGYVCTPVNTALSNGILWVNSAGNSALQHYRSTFSDIGSGYHVFSGPDDTINQIGRYVDGEYVRVVMNWDDYTNKDQDYDLYLARYDNPNWVLVDSSKIDQDGAHNPEEIISFLNTENDTLYGILVKKRPGAIDINFTIFNLDKNLGYYTESSSLTDPGTITNVVTVGAINRNAYTSGPQEPFSSQGPTTDGRMKPDVAAPDNCISHAFGYWYGTSLASPHTAGVCALIKSRHTGYTASDIRSYLYNDCTVDLTPPPGKDNIYGWGKVVMPDISITVTSPNGSEEWQVGSSQNITWNSSGTSGNVHIEYSTNNGSNWTDVIASTTDDGIHPWTIPNAPSEECLIRISDTDGGDPSDVSNATFTIYTTPDITVSAPDGGENWLVGSDEDITWTSVGTSGDVHIEYSINNGSNWANVIASTPDDGTHSWTIPDEPSENCLVRISDTDGNPSDVSDAVFTISSAPFISVTAPNGGENWRAGSTQDVTWTSGGTSGDVHIEYSINDGTDWADVIASTPDDGTHSWTIPDEPSEDCLVRISDTDGSPSDTSDAVFTISPVPYITITAPNGGENWYINSVYDIIWVTNLTVEEDVRIEYSIDNGSNWSQVIAAKPGDTLAYAWTIPNTPSDSCLVMITDTATGLTSDTSDALFSISPTPYITVTAPNGGEEWYIDSTYNITWNSGFTTGDVSIEYSTDSGTSWSDIITSMPDTGVYPWQIPNTPTTTCLVSIADTNGSLSDTSDATFTITAPVPVPFAKIPTVYSMDIRTVTTGNKLEIKYGLPKRTDVVFEIYDIKGTRIKEISENNTAGFHSKEIDISINPAGVYFIKIEAKVENFTKLTKFILVK